MLGLFRRPPADRTDTTPEPIAAAAHQIGRLLAQLQLVDQLTTAALVNGRDYDLALDIRSQLGMSMVVPSYRPATVAPDKGGAR